MNNQSIEKFELPTIHYVIGGMFGDFIHSLSVINENFYETGRKGMLFIADGFGGDHFRNGVENTFNDTYEIIKKQRYIKDYQKYNHQEIHINLNSWRIKSNVFSQNWYQTYKQSYNIEWGKHKWLDVNLDKKWENTVLINTVDYRFSENIEMNDLLLKYSLNDCKFCFISHDENQYLFFINKYNLNKDSIDFYKFDDFISLCTIINSCKLFIGGMSSPLAIACSLKKQCICLGMNQFPYFYNHLNWDNLEYIV